jgi:hypothetical protein
VETNLDPGEELTCDALFLAVVGHQRKPEDAGERHA